MSKLQLGITQKEPAQGMGEKPHIIIQGIVHNENDNVTDKLDQVDG